MVLAALYCRPDPVAYAAGVVSRLIAARRTGGRAVPDAWLHPLSVATYAYLTGLSCYRRARGQLAWKGRRLS